MTNYNDIVASMAMAGHKLRDAKNAKTPTDLPKTAVQLLESAPCPAWKDDSVFMAQYREWYAQATDVLRSNKTSLVTDK